MPKTTKPVDDAPDHLFWVIEETLSDGSTVFNVEFGDTVWPCVTENDAADLAETIADAINKHSNSSAGVMYR